MLMRVLPARYLHISEILLCVRAGCLELRYAVDHNISLYELLGQTPSVGARRAPYNRARIVEVLSRGDTKIVDLTKQLGLTLEDVRQHLRKLEGLGVLSFDSLNFEKKGVKPYTWVQGKSPHQARHLWGLKTLTSDVAGWLYKNKRADRHEIAQGLNYRHLTQISRVLVSLVKQGLAQTDYMSADKSRIWLSKKSGLITKFVRAIRNALDDKPDLKDMSAILGEFSRDDELFGYYVNRGVKIYNSVSPNLNARTAESRESELLRFLNAYQDREKEGPRPVDVVRQLGWTPGTVTRNLSALLRKGLVGRERKGPVTRYTQMSPLPRGTVE